MIKIFWWMTLFITFWEGPVRAELFVCQVDGTPNERNHLTRHSGDCKELGKCTGFDNSGLDANCIIATQAEYDAAVELKKLDTGQPEGSRVVAMTAGEQTTITNAESAAADAALRTDSKRAYDGQTISGQTLRCMADVIIKEINIVRGWTVDFKAETAASTSLADFKTRVATLATLNDRTLSQAKNSIQACIDNGDVDE